MIDPGLYWYVLRTKPHREKHVGRQLAQRGIETYFPMLKAFRKYLREGQRQLEPLFPGYLFARVTISSRYAEIQNLSGMREVVRFGEHVPHLEAEVIAALRRCETGEGYIRIRPPALLRAAQPVCVTGGLFAGQEGLFCRYSEATERVSVLLDLLHQQVHLELPSSQVKSKTHAPAAARCAAAGPVRPG